MTARDTAIAPDTATSGLKDWVTMCKLRIGTMIALTALMGYAALAESLNPTAAALLMLATLLGSCGSSVFNHVFDRDIDRLMDRTRNRPLASGRLRRTWPALTFGATLLAAGVIMAGLLLNWTVAAHIFAGAFMYGIVYTVWLKRRTWWNIVIGGAAGSFAVLAGAAAVEPESWRLPMLLAITLFLWTPPHFWALAILLKDDYARAGVPMLPVVIGEAACAKRIEWNAWLLTGSTLLPIATGDLGLAYAAIAIPAGVWFVYLTRKLVQTGGRAAARRVFLGSMSYLSLLFLAVIAGKHLV